MDTRPSGPTCSAAPASAGTSREPSFLGQVGGQLQVRVEPGHDPPVDLEEQALAEDGRAVRLVGTERALRPAGDLRGAAGGEARQGQPGTADESPARGRREDPALGHRERERPPGAVAVVRLACGRAAVPDDERHEVPIRSPLGVGQLDEREDRRTTSGGARAASTGVRLGHRPQAGRSETGRSDVQRPEIHRVHEPEPADDPPLPAVPAPSLEQVEGQRGLDRGVQSLIITCLTTV